MVALNKRLGLLQFLYNSPPQALYTYPRRSLPILDLPYQFNYPLTHLRRFTPIPTHSHPSKAVHTHQSLYYQYQDLFTHLKSFKPFQALHTHLNLFTPTQALNTLLKPFIPILGPPRPPKDCHTYLWHLMPLLGTPALFLGL